MKICPFCGIEFSKPKDLGHYVWKPKKYCSRKCYRRAYYLRNRDQHLQYVKDWRERNPEKAKTSQRAYYLHNRDQILQYGRTWRDRNPERVRAYSRAYQKNNPEKINASQRAWKKKNPEKCNAQYLARRLVSLGSECSLCGSVEGLERHHPDYSKPLEIITLCTSCHGKVHRVSLPIPKV